MFSERLKDYLIKASAIALVSLFFGGCAMWLILIWLLITTPVMVVVP